MNKHAYLIIAHSDFSLLNNLISMIDDERNDIYIHIDLGAKKLYNKCKHLITNKAGLYILKNRINVYWGDISQVNAEYLLFETASRMHQYLYYHLLSGADLPLKSQDYIHNFFKENQGKEFIEFWNDKFHQKDLNRKVSRYYFFLKYYKNKKHPLHNLTSTFRNLALLIQKISQLKRKRNFAFKKGGYWVSITHPLCRYIIKNKDKIKKRLRYTLCPDEIFIQTLVWNSPFRNNIYKSKDTNPGNMRLIDWTRGNPYIWTDNDFDELISSEALFARKFNSSTTSLHNMLKNIICNE